MPIKSLIPKIDNAENERGIALVSTLSPILIEDRLEVLTSTGGFYFTKNNKRTKLSFNVLPSDPTEDVDQIWLNVTEKKIKWKVANTIYEHLLPIDSSDVAITSGSKLYAILLDAETNRSEIISKDIENTIYDLFNGVSNSTEIIVNNVVSENSGIVLVDGATSGNYTQIKKQSSVVNAVEGLLTYRQQAHAPSNMLDNLDGTHTVTFKGLTNFTTTDRVLAYTETKTYEGVNKYGQGELRQEDKPINKKSAIFAIGVDLKPVLFVVTSVVFDSLLNTTTVIILDQDFDLTLGSLNIVEEIRFVTYKIKLECTADNVNNIMEEVIPSEIFSVSDNIEISSGSIPDGVEMTYIKSKIGYEKCNSITVKHSKNKKYWVIFARFAQEGTTNIMRLWYSNDGLKTMELQEDFNNYMATFTNTDNDGTYSKAHDSNWVPYADSNIDVSDDGRFFAQLYRYRSSRSYPNTGIVLLGEITSSGCRVGYPTHAFGGFDSEINFETSNSFEYYMAGVKVDWQSNLAFSGASRHTEDYRIQCWSLDFDNMDAHASFYEYIGADYLNNHDVPYMDIVEFEGTRQLVIISKHNNHHLYIHKGDIGLILKTIKNAEYNSTFGNDSLIIPALRANRNDIFHEYAAGSSLFNIGMNENKVLACQMIDVDQGYLVQGYLDFANSNAARCSVNEFVFDTAPVSGAFTLGILKDGLLVATTADINFDATTTDIALAIGVAYAPLVGTTITDVSKHFRIPQTRARLFDETIYNLKPNAYFVERDSLLNNIFNMQFDFTSTGGAQLNFKVEVVDTITGTVSYTYSNIITDITETVNVPLSAFPIVRDNDLELRITSNTTIPDNILKCSVVSRSNVSIQTSGFWLPTVLGSATVKHEITYLGDVNYTFVVNTNTLVDVGALAVTATETNLQLGLAFKSIDIINQGINNQAGVWDANLGKSVTLRNSTTVYQYDGHNYQTDGQEYTHSSKPHEIVFRGNSTIVAKSLEFLEYGGDYATSPSVIKVPNFKELRGVTFTQGVQNSATLLGNRDFYASTSTLVCDYVAQMFTVPDLGYSDAQFPLRTLDIYLRKNWAANTAFGFGSDAYVRVRIVGTAAGFPDEFNVLAESSTKWPLADLPNYSDATVDARKAMPFIFNNVKLTPTSQVAVLIDVVNDAGTFDITLGDLGTMVDIGVQNGTYTDALFQNIGGAWGTDKACRLKFTMYDYYHVVVPYNTPTFEVALSQNTIRRPFGNVTECYMEPVDLANGEFIGNFRSQQYTKRNSFDNSTTEGGSTAWTFSITDKASDPYLPPVIGQPQILGHKDSEYDQNLVFGHAFGVSDGSKYVNSDGKPSTKYGVSYAPNSCSHNGGFHLSRESESSVWGVYNDELSNSTTSIDGNFKDPDFRYGVCTSIRGQYCDIHYAVDKFHIAYKEFVAEFEIKPVLSAGQAHTIWNRGYDIWDISIRWDTATSKHYFVFSSIASGKAIALIGISHPVINAQYVRMRVSRSYSTGFEMFVNYTSNDETAWVKVTLDLTAETTLIVYEITAPNTSTGRPFNVLDIEGSFGKHVAIGNLASTASYMRIGRWQPSVANRYNGRLGYFKFAIGTSTFKYAGINFEQTGTYRFKHRGNKVIAFKHVSNYPNNYYLQKSRMVVMNPAQLLGSEVYTPEFAVKYDKTLLLGGNVPATKVSFTSNGDEATKVNGLLMEFKRK